MFDVFDGHQHLHPQRGSDQQPHQHIRHAQAAVEAFNQALFRGFFWRGLDFFRRRPTRLLVLSELSAAAHNLAASYQGVKTVTIREIIGTEGRVNDFDRRFYPRQGRMLARWINILMAREDGIPLPPIELIQVWDLYFVRDGHHRISVAKIMGEEYIEAEVTLWDGGPVPPFLPRIVKPAFALNFSKK